MNNNFLNYPKIKISKKKFLILKSRSPITNKL